MFLKLVLILASLISGSVTSSNPHKPRANDDDPCHGPGTTCCIVQQGQDTCG